MELAFETIDLRTMCENDAIAQELLGVEAATMLKHRLADLRAAESIRDLPLVVPPDASSNGQATVLVHLCNKIYIVVCSNHRRPPTRQDNAIDWARVNRVRILRIGEEHEPSLRI